MGKLRPPHINKASRSCDLVMRCSPLDIDTYFHMNNAIYLRMAELSRWRMFPASGSFETAIKQKVMFLAVEQKVSYLKPIAALQRYVIRTQCDVFKDDKWLHYEHMFLQHPDDVPHGKTQQVFAKVELRAVMKYPTGQTVKPSTLMEANDFSRSFYRKHDTERQS